MSDFKTEVRVFVAAVVAFVAAYAVNAFFNSMLEACAHGNIIKARFWYMLAVLGLTIAVIFILVEYGNTVDDDDDEDDADVGTSDKTISGTSELNRSPLRRKLFKK